MKTAWFRHFCQHFLWILTYLNNFDIFDWLFWHFRLFNWHLSGYFQSFNQKTIENGKTNVFEKWSKMDIFNQKMTEIVKFWHILLIKIQFWHQNLKYLIFVQICNVWPIWCPTPNCISLDPSKDHLKLCNSVHSTSHYSPCDTRYAMILIEDMR